ncbi:MAG: 30S ribosomal protein S20 [Phycisphaerales bacterium]|nr:30S ribosomal protein S20 [Phycisphaerales bacterium]
MAHSRTARKAVRQNATRRARNRWRLSTMREALKEMREKLLHGTVKECEELQRKVSRLIDRTAASGVIHKNQAARRKSRLVAAVRAKAKTGAKAK